MKISMVRWPGGQAQANFPVENWGQAPRKKKGAKKKENGGLWKLTPLMEIRSERGFPQRLGKHKTLSTVPTRPDGGSRGTLIHQQSGAKSKDQKGPNQVDETREKTFPRRMSAQLDYLADSIAGRSIVSPRRSRDICGKARAEERRSSRYRIIRYEYYIECTCGYKVPARDSACRKCGTPIPLFKELLWGTGFA